MPEPTDTAARLPDPMKPEKRPREGWPMERKTRETAAPCLAEVWVGDLLIRCFEDRGHDGNHAARFEAATDNPYRADADVEVTWTSAMAPDAAAKAAPRIPRPAWRPFCWRHLTWMCSRHDT